MAYKVSIALSLFTLSRNFFSSIVNCSDNALTKLIFKVKVQKPDGGEVYKYFNLDQLEFKKNKQENNAKNDEDLEELEKILD